MHALSCPKGNLPTICHNEIRDLTASLLMEVRQEVSIEPDLYNPSQEKPRARLDVAMSGFWGAGK